MSEKLKLLFDECVGRAVLPKITEFLGISENPPELSHVLQFQEQGVHDEDWIPQIAEERWIVVTADRGRRGKQSKGEKLPLVCRQFGVTHVMLSSSIHHKSNFDKIRILLEVWPGIIDLVNAPRGSGYLLRLTTAGHAQLVQVYAPPSEPSA